MASGASCGSSESGGPPEKTKDEEQAMEKKQFLWEKDSNGDEDSEGRCAVAKYSKKFRENKKQEKDNLVLENMQLTLQLQKEQDEIEELEELEKLLLIIARQFFNIWLMHNNTKILKSKEIEYSHNKGNQFSKMKNSGE